MKRPKAYFGVGAVMLVGLLQIWIIDAKRRAKLPAYHPGNKNEQILFDVSTFIQNHMTLSRNRTLSDIWSNESSRFYYDINSNLNGCQFGINEPDNVTVDKTNYSCASDRSINGVAIIVNGNASISNLQSLTRPTQPFSENAINELLSTADPFMESMIISVIPHISMECDCSKRLHKFSHFMDTHLGNVSNNKGVKIGLEVNEPLVDCCIQLPEFHLPSIVDHVVFRAQLSCSTAMFSYGLFLNAIDDYMRKLQSFISKSNGPSTVYLRLYTSAMENAAIESLVFQYVKTKMSDANEKPVAEMYIMRPTHTNHTAAGSTHFLKEKVTPWIYTGKTSIFNRNVSRQQTSEGWQILKILSSVHDNILLVNPSPSLVAGYHQIDNDKSLQSSSKEKLARASMLFTKDDVSLPRVAERMSQLLKGDVSLNIGTIYIDWAYKRMPDKKMILLPLTSKSVKIGCYLQVSQYGFWDYDVDRFLKMVVDECGGLWNVSSQILMHVSLDINAKEELFERLEIVNKEKMAIETAYKSKTVVPMIRIVSWVGKHRTNNFSAGSAVNMTYCDRNVKLLNEYYQVIRTFADVYHWNELVLIPATNSYHDFSLWRNVETTEEINRLSTNFPLLYRTNAEKSMNGNEFRMTYQCVNYTGNTRKRPLTVINFLGNQSTGATFTTKLRKTLPVTADELQAALLFALTRFPFVELTGTTEQEFGHIKSILNHQVLDAIKSYRNLTHFTEPLIYFQVSISEAPILHQYIHDITARPYVAVHLSGWENSTIQELDRVFPIIGSESRLPSKFGIMVQNCSQEINMQLVNLKKLPFMNLVEYVVCNVNSVLPSNSNRLRMQGYLDNWFYTKSYMEHFLSTSSAKLKVMFRINFDSASRRCPDAPDLNREMFLSFTNDVRQHGETFGIRYFVVPAFADEELAKDCPHTWYRITDYSDLAKAHVYVDREKEWFGEVTKLGIRIESPERKSVESNGVNIYLITVLPFTAVVALGVLLLWLQRRHYQKNFLTHKEVNQFYKASVMSDDEMELTETNHRLTCEYIKFPANFEIPARDVQVQEEVGRGQFGVVHVGLLRKQTEVAIKIPRADCSKEEFISALSELKILCCVGSHPNIVSFLGAHTRNIRRGKLMIVTEYCAQGSLESYIRNLSLDATHDLNPLYEFSHQIAAGMEHLSEKRIIHGDLATRNVLLTAEFTCKISDFGLSRRLYEVNVYVKRGNEALPWMWMAPESLRDMEFTTRSDVWSYAVTLWEIFTLGKLPYPGRYLTHGFILELESGFRMEKADLASDAIHKKMLECWSLVQDQRPTFTELKHYFAALRHHHYQNTNLA